MKKIVTNSPEETKKLAKKFAKNLKGGEVFGLIGNLGAGKTVFVQGLAEGLGIKEIVNSPTFVLMKCYKLQDKSYKIRELVHVDAYRIDGPAELLDIGLGEYLSDKNSLVVIEWAEKVKKILPANSIIITFDIKNNNQREIRIKR
jgi:tRNA threonylcarbamoyladenosine biosynthesis protein TsaE